MDNTSFDLLALPRVALQTCFSFMLPSQLYAISRTSERCKDRIKGIKFKVYLTAFESHIDVYCPHRQWEIFRIGTEETQINEQEWRDSVMEFRSLFGRINEIYRSSNNFDEIWESINEEKSGLEGLNLTILNAEDPQRIIKTILDNSELKQLNNLVFDLDTPETFKYTDPFIFKNTPKYLRISDSSWFTVQNLMDCQVESCYLSDSKLTDEDINFILKNWKNQFHNLKTFSVDRRDKTDTNINAVLNGSEHKEEAPKNGYSIFKLTFNDEFYFRLVVFMDCVRIEKTSR